MIFKNQTRRRGLRAFSLATAAALTAGLAITAAPAAHASADRSVWVPLADQLTIEKYGIKGEVPKGVFTFKVNGGDRWVDSIGGSFHSPFLPVTNWQVRGYFVNENGEAYEPFSSDFHPSQDRRGDWSIPINKEMKYGQVCGFLFSNGQLIKRAGICHNITKPYIIERGEESGPYKAGQKVGRVINKLNPFD